MFRDVVTVFNFHELTGLWYTTVFKNCDLRETKAGKKSAGAGDVNDSKVTLLVNVRQDKSAHTIIYKPNRIVDNQGVGLLSGDRLMLSYTDPDTDEVKRYAGPKAYGQMEDPRGFFTFNPACDFMAAGNFFSAPVRDDDYDEGLYQAMNQAQNEVYKIVSAAFFGLIPHFEIGGA